MDATAKNEKIARDIINTLAENGCTVAEALDILRYAGCHSGALCQGSGG